MNQLMTPIALAITAVLFLWALLAHRDRSLSRAIFTTVITLAIIPTFGPAPLVVSVPVVASSAILLLAISRSPGSLRITWGILGIWAFVIVVALSHMDFAKMLSSGLVVAQAFTYCVLAAACAKLPSAGAHPVFSALLILLPVQLLLAVAEQLRVIPAVWARDQSAEYHDITLRTNELVPQLIGRSTGTFAHPILLGTFAAVTAVLCVLVAFRTRRAVYFFAAAAALTTLALSGTRSAAIAATVAIALYVVFTPGKARAFRVILGVAVLAIVLNGQLLDRIVTAEVQSSASYQHRIRILSSVPSLLGRDDATVLFGSGATSVDQMFSEGVVVGYGTFRFFDNQYIRLLALSGLVALVLFAVVALRGVFIGNAASRAMLIVFLIMMASFDTLTWGFTYAQTIIALVGGIALPFSETRKRTVLPTQKNQKAPEPAS